MGTLEGETFCECSSLEKIIIPEGVRVIGYRAFSDCKSLKSISLPDGLEKMGMRCFWKTGLEEIVFPASLREVGPDAFYCCKRLKSVQLNEGLERLGTKEILYDKEYEGSAFAYTAIESVRLPSTLKRIESWTFNYCRNLKSVKLPRGVEYIGEKCF